MLEFLIFQNDTLFEYIGYAAGLATILTFTIQIFQIIASKNVSNLSSYMYTIYSLSLVCWFTYGVYIDSNILLFSNLATFFCVFIILILIIYYDAEDKIERERRDDITPVYNKKYFDETVPVKIAELSVADQPYSFLILNINNMNEIHQQYKEKISHKVLKTFASAIEKDLRSSDMIARHNDDTFTVFLSGADEKGAKIVANRLEQIVKNLNIKINRKVSISISVKIGGCSSKNANNLQSLHYHALVALKEITAKSKSKIKFYKKKRDVFV